MIELAFQIPETAKSFSFDLYGGQGVMTGVVKRVSNSARRRESAWCQVEIPVSQLWSLDGVPCHPHLPFLARAIRFKVLPQRFGDETTNIDASFL